MSAWTAAEIANAWEPLGPSAETTWSTEAAGHLLRRAGFGGSTTEIAELASMDVDDAVDRLLLPTEAEAFDAEAEATIRMSLVLGSTDHLVDWWLYRMRHDPHAVREKATWLWHGHFCTSRVKVPDARLLLAQNQMLRRGALGSFADLVKAVSRDAAMLIYLDSTENSKARPNENYARELLELFCLGLGNYQEQDIKELARCFTGWEVRRQRFRFSTSDHDNGRKELFSKAGSFEGDEAIDLVLAQPAAPRHIAATLIRFYVTEDPVPEAVIDGLADCLVGNQWEIEPTLRTLFRSQCFYSERARGRIVSSPVAWTVRWLRALETNVDLNWLRRNLEAMGCVPFEPPNVKGWPGGTAWVDPARMIARARWVQQLVDQPIDPPGGLSSWLTRRGLNRAEEIVEWVESYLIGRAIQPERRKRLLEIVSSESGSGGQMRTAIRVASLIPEAHVG